MKHFTPGRILVAATALLALELPLRSAQNESIIPSAYAGRPYTGQPASIPGMIQAEAYDLAPGNANGVTFNYNGQPKQSAFRTAADSIGLAAFGRGHVTTSGQPEDPAQIYAGWTHVGEWWNYTVNVTHAGTYRIGGHFASGSKDARLAFTFTPQSRAASPAGAVIATGALPVPTTAGFQPAVEVYHVWEKLDALGEVTLPAGVYILTVKVEKEAGLNVDYFTFTPKP